MLLVVKILATATFKAILLKFSRFVDSAQGIEDFS